MLRASAYVARSDRQISDEFESFMRSPYVATSVLLATLCRSVVLAGPVEAQQPACEGDKDLGKFVRTLRMYVWDSACSEYVHLCVCSFYSIKIYPN